LPSQHEFAQSRLYLGWFPSPSGILKVTVPGLDSASHVDDLLESHIGEHLLSYTAASSNGSVDEGGKIGIKFGAPFFQVAQRYQLSPRKMAGLVLLELPDVNQSEFGAHRIRP